MERRLRGNRTLRPWESTDERLEHAIITLYKVRRVEEVEVFLRSFEIENAEQYITAKEMYLSLSDEARQVLYALVVTPEEVFEAFDTMLRQLNITQRLILYIRRRFGCNNIRAQAAIKEAKKFMREIDNRRC
jgi:hypothetical protein